MGTTAAERARGRGDGGIVDTGMERNDVKGKVGRGVEVVAGNQCERRRGILQTGIMFSP